MIKKEIIRVDFRYFWPAFSKNDNFFLDLLKKDYDVVIDPINPQIVFFSVFETSSLKNTKKIFNLLKASYLSLQFKLKKKIYSIFQLPLPLPYKMPSIKGNFIRVFYTAENIKPDMKKCDWAFSFYHDKQMRNEKHMRLPIYVFEEYSDYLIKKVDFERIKKEKTRFCNFVYRNDVYFRNNFFKKLSKYKKIDSPGPCMNNMPKIASIVSDPRNPYKNKLNFLKNYKFTIAFENSLTPGYTTEKLVHPMMVNSIPIYFGNPEVAEDFNPESFIHIKDFKDFDNVIRQIKEIDRDDNLYKKMLREPWLKDNKKNKYMDKMNIRERLRQIVESSKEIKHTYLNKIK
jgi:alpha(1,3/1,4) fucosyltransferase